MAITSGQNARRDAAADDKLLTRRDAAAWLGIKPQTLSVWHSTGRYAIPVVHVGRSVRYRRSDLERWLANRTRTRSA